MNGREYEIKLDIHKGVLEHKDIRFVSEDYEHCLLRFRITMNEIPYDITDSIVKMAAIGQLIDCKIIDSKSGIVEAKLPSTMLSVSGDYRAELKLFESNNPKNRLTTPIFRFNVRKALGN